MFTSFVRIRKYSEPRSLLAFLAVCGQSPYFLRTNPPGLCPSSRAVLPAIPRFPPPMLRFFLLFPALGSANQQQRSLEQQKLRDLHSVNSLLPRRTPTGTISGFGPRLLATFPIFPFLRFFFVLFLIGKRSRCCQIEKTITKSTENLENVITGIFRATKI